MGTSEGGLLSLLLDYILWSYGIFFLEIYEAICRRELGLAFEVVFL